MRGQKRGFPGFAKLEKSMRLISAFYALLGLGLLLLLRSEVPEIALIIWVLRSAWLIALVALIFNLRWADWVAFGAYAAVLGFLLVRSVARFAFIVEHQGLDCAEPPCDGPPGAFAAAWGGELLFLAVGIVLAVRHLRAGWRGGAAGRAAGARTG